MKTFEITFFLLLLIRNSFVNYITFVITIRNEKKRLKFKSNYYGKTVTLIRFKQI